MIVFQISLNFDAAKEILKIHFNEEGNYSEEIKSNNEDFRSTILQSFQFEPEQKKTCSNESHEKKATKAVVRRYSSN